MLKCEKCEGADFTITATHRSFVCDGCGQVFGQLRNDNSIIHCGKCGGSNIEISENILIADEPTVLTFRCAVCDIRQDVPLVKHDFDTASEAPETGDNL